MSYLVLARKWRPKNFAEVVGQEHVVRTLQHALDNDHLHHAHLFTGTRGVGKTTLARIVAKALNCQQGVSSAPCGVCNPCQEIDEGRFIDLIEVDAASRTKVEDTRTLLENVPYKATIGRYKVYLIDEIHMLTGHSFNALLKTLEEPPAHVKFLMATTDPQKLPVTVLSRCIQFNLRALDEKEISGQLVTILKHENIGFEAGALRAIARQSRGSMRDGLSLLDQAISYTQGNISTKLIRDMLGLVATESIVSLLAGIAKKDANSVLSLVKRMCQRSISFEAALDELLLTLHNLSLLKIAPSSLNERSANLDELKSLEKLMSVEDVQLFYQIGLIGKRDLALAPEPQLGFEMILLRMLAFHPNQISREKVPQQPDQGRRKPTPITRNPEPRRKTRNYRPAAPTKERPVARPSRPHIRNPGVIREFTQINNNEDWIRFVTQSKQLAGITKEFASRVTFKQRTGNKITLIPPVEKTAAMTRVENRSNLLNVLQRVFGNQIRVTYSREPSNNVTPASRMARKRKEKLAQVRQQMEQERIPKALEREFGAKLEMSSIRFPSRKRKLSDSES